MKIKLLFVFPTVLLCTTLWGQEGNETQEKKVELSGYVKNDMYFDNRQMVDIREGQFNLYPKDIQLDPDGKDINAAASFNMVAIQSRLKVKFSGPMALGAKTSGLIEGAFFGHSNTDINGFRLRHAIGKLNWDKTELLFGQTWHPAFITHCFPGTIAFNTGAPMQTLSRNPQIKLTRHAGNLSIIGAILTQRDFVSINADGTSSSTALRNAVMPDFQFQLHYTKNNEDKTGTAAGIGAGYKTLVPQLVTPQGYSTNEKVNSYLIMAFYKIQLTKFTAMAQLTYGANLTDLVMLGGYAISDSIFEADNSTKGFVKYTSIETLAAWIDVNTNREKHNIGLFAGYTQNMGSKDDIVGKVYARGANIQHVYRISPRYYLNAGKMRFAAEPDYTVAGYMRNPDSKLHATEVEDVGGFRLLISAFYFF